MNTPEPVVGAYGSERHEAPGGPAHQVEAFDDG